MNYSIEEMRSLVKKSDDLQKRISLIDDLVDNIRITGRCVNIEFKYSKHVDDGWNCGHTSFSESIDHKRIGLTEKQFEEMFTGPIINYLENIKNETQKEYDEILIDNNKVVDEDYDIVVDVEEID